MRPPHPRPFLEAEAGAPSPEADAIIVGLACDGGVSFRPGAAQGPAGIREFSESIESFSPRARRDLADLQLVDIGDHLERETIEETIGRVLAESWSGSSRPLLVGIGGDHSVTPPTVAAVASRVPGLAVVGFDAHLDLREDYPGDHACTYRRITERGVRCYVNGVRSGSRDEWGALVLAGKTGEILDPRLHEDLAHEPIYITVDIDVLDPSVAPGTGNPEPGGATFDGLLGALEELAGLNIVGFDVVEVSPPLDPSGITQVTAAVIVREAILRFVRPR